MRKIPIIFCIDVEPDERETDVVISKDWKGFEEGFKFFTQLRPQLEKATAAPVNFCWFFRMDPQIELTYGQPAWVVERYGEAIKRLEQSGDEVGLHVHAWRWNEEASRWVIDHGNQKWIDYCLQVSFGAYQKAFGRPCLSFRFGDHWMNNETVNSLEAMGVKFDLTVEPGRRAKPTITTGELHTGGLPDYTTAPRWPYRPSQNDFRKRLGEPTRPLWIIPISTGKEPGRFPVLKRTARAFGIDLQRRHEEGPLNLSIRSAGFSAMLDRLINTNPKPYVAAVLRSESCGQPASRAHLKQNLDGILSHPMVRSFQFVRPADAIKLLN
jgi:hypothetical protein